MKKIILLLSIFFINVNFVYAKEEVEFYKCVDGDTFRAKINGEEHYVRMLAVDTPESVKSNSKVEYYGKEASEYTCNRLSKAKKIELEYDDNADKYDKYERVLAWVFVDGKLLQEDLIKNGYGKVAYLYDNYKYAEELKKLQEEVSIKEIGIWNQKEKEKFDNDSYEEENTEEEITLMEVILMGIGFLIVIFLSDKVLIKDKKKKIISK